MINMLNDFKDSSWYCHKCQETLPSSSDDLRYFIEVGFVYHYHKKGDVYYRALKFSNEDENGCFQFDLETGILSTPWVLLDGKGHFIPGHPEEIPPIGKRREEVFKTDLVWELNNIKKKF